VPVEVKQGRETVAFTTDEHVRASATLESMTKLKPVFDKQGIVTAGNASGINDGASLMLVTSAAKARELGLRVAGRLVAYAVTGVDPAYMGIGPVSATRKALDKAGMAVNDLALFEVNEAFASVAVAIGRELKLPEDKVNPLGGAIALGHPIGATGAVLVTKLLHELARTDQQYGLATLCIGGGMGIAAIFERAS
jgi:acetyl-CoA C-acetyltransferase